MLTASVNLSFAGASAGKTITVSAASTTVATSKRAFDIMHPPHIFIYGLAAACPIGRSRHRSNLWHILSLPGGGASLRLALGLTGGEHGAEVVVDRRGPPRCRVLGVLGPYVGPGQPFAHAGLGGELAIRLHNGVDRTAVEARLQTMQPAVEVEDFLIRHKIRHRLRLLGRQILDLGLQGSQLALESAHA